MIEIRAVEGALGERVRLEYRFVTPNVDASGALCAPGEWSSWKEVPWMDAETARKIDLHADNLPPLSR
jgi:hypothetical protein